MLEMVHLHLPMQLPPTWDTAALVLCSAGTGVPEMETTFPSPARGEAGRQGMNIQLGGWLRHQSNFSVLAVSAMGSTSCESQGFSSSL